jgi:O-antigen ligase
VAERHRLAGPGEILYVTGLSILAVSSSFSLTLSEGGLLLAWVGLILKSGKALRFRRPILLDWLVIGLLLWTLVSALMSGHRTASLKAYRSEWLVLTYFLISLGMESVDRLWRFLKLLAGVAAITAVYGIIQHFTGVDYIKHRTVYIWNGIYGSIGLLGHHITFGVFYAWIMSLNLALLVSASQKLRSRLTWAVFGCLSALAVLYSYSRAAWLGALASFGAIITLKRLRVGYFLMIVVGVVVVAVALEPSAIQRMTGTATAEIPSKGDATRVLLIRTSLRMIASQPVLGIGPGTFMLEFDRYKLPGEYSTTCHPHNDYLGYAVHTGLVGLGILMAVLATALSGALRVFRTGEASRRSCALAMIAGLIALMVSGLFQCNLTDSEIAIQAWVIMGAIGMLVRARIRETDLSLRHS